MRNASCKSEFTPPFGGTGAMRDVAVMQTRKGQRTVHEQLAQKAGVSFTQITCGDYAVSYAFIKKGANKQ